MCISQRTEDRGQRTESRLSSVLCPLSSERGISLIELIMFIVIISIAVTGVLLVMNRVTGHSADTLVRKQALAIAESLLEEIELQDFSLTSSGAASRANFINIMDYNNYATTAGIVAIDGTPVAGLGSYNVSAVVAATTLGNIPAASAVAITVTVSDPTGQTLQATGYRVNY